MLETEVIFTALFLFECLLRLHEDEVAYWVTPIGEPIRFSAPLIIKFPVVFGLWVLARPSPIRYTPDSITTKTKSLPFESVAEIRHNERSVLINGKATFRCRSKAEAAYWSNLLQHWTQSQGDRAAQMASHLASTFDTNAAKQAFLQVRRRLRPLLAMTGAYSLLWIATLIATWSEVSFMVRYLWAWVTCLAIFHFATVAVTASVAWTLGQRKGEFVSTILLSLLSPFHAVRGGDNLSQNSLHMFDPVVVSCVAGSSRQTVALLEMELRKAHSGVQQDWYQERRRIHLEKIAHYLGKSVADLLAKPVPEAESVAFCPICKAQYMLKGTCSDCSVKLEAF